MQRTAPAMAVRPTTTNPLRRWLAGRSWRWWATCWLILGLSEFAAIFAQMDSRLHVIAPDPAATAPSVGSYDAGWPFVYAHVRSAPLDIHHFGHFLQMPPPMAQWNWFLLISDIAWTGLIFALGAALPVLVWHAVRQNARGTPRGEFWRTAVIALVVVGAWFAFAITIVGNINAGQPTDEATWAQLTPPVTFAALLPGVLSFVVQRGFEGDGGLGIALANGPANSVELVLVLLVAVALPAGIMTGILLAAQRTRRRFRRTPTPPPAEVHA
ncbi:MAG: hypothetical protein H0X24_13100 [Ktedonobacterales bacterium]|nr:hypothetical protein [Ktedonobacterales bacterium]